MKWHIQIIMAFFCINSMIWAGMDALPPEVQNEYNWGENAAVSRQVIETWFQIDGDDTTSDDWGDPDVEKLEADVTTEAEDIFQIPASVLGGFLGSIGKAFSYIIGFLAGVTVWFGAMHALLLAMGVPQPWVGIISMTWVIAFLVAIIAFITGRDV